MVNHQEYAHPEDHDYDSGSPHLKHPHLRERIQTSLREAVAQIIDQRGECRALEVGAGHGDFTETLIGAGAIVTVTEMSGPSARRLERIYLANANVQVVYDPDGSWLESSDDLFDLVVCVSVLHHIPDYMAFLRLAFSRTRRGGGFVSWQDPLWYPRRTKGNLRFEKLSYYTWRVTRGNLIGGLQTRIRRARGVIDESNPADMVEYHVVRNGVDEQVILRLASQEFESIELNSYWSTQNIVLQRFGEHDWAANTFGVIARGGKR